MGAAKALAALPPELAARVWARAQAVEAANDPSKLTLERLLTRRDCGALAASPTQRALARAVDGLPVDLGDERMRFHFGTAELPPVRPKYVVVRTGVRAGKSLLAAMGFLRSILSCHLASNRVRPDELVRAPIVAPRLKVGGAPFHHLVGTMRASPVLAPLLVSAGAESCRIRRPDGYMVEVELVAASSGGINIRSTWLAGALFDEADFHDDESGAVNLPDNLRAVATRMAHGAQIWLVSSPWSDTGPFHELFTGAFGSPGRTLAFHSDSRNMNPTLSLEDELAERARDPDNAAREYDAIPLSSNSAAFFPADAIERAVNADRDLYLQPVRGARYGAGTDLGFRKNSSALAVAEYGARVRLAYHEEKRPQKGAPLKPSEVLQSFAATCLRYGVPTVRGDLHYAETAHEELAKARLGGDEHHPARVAYEEWNPTAEHQTEVFTEFRRRLVEGLVELPNDPRLLKMLKDTKARPLPGGRIQVQLPKHGSAHADVLQAVVLACTGDLGGGQAQKSSTSGQRETARRGGGF